KLGKKLFSPKIKFIVEYSRNLPMDGKGIGHRPNPTVPIPVPPKKARGKKVEVKEKGGKNVLKVKKTHTAKVIPEPAASSFSSKRKHKVKLLNEQFNFDTLCRKIKQSSNKAQILLLYFGALDSGLTDAEQQTLNQLMMEKSPTVIAALYLEQLYQQGCLPEQLLILCSLETLQKKQSQLKSLAGRMQPFIDCSSVHAALQKIMPLEILSGELEYSLEQALDVAEQGGEEFDCFLAGNQNLLLFAELLLTRAALGVPENDVTNFRILAQLKQKSASKVAEILCKNLMSDNKQYEGLKKLQVLAEKTESQLHKYLTQKKNQGLIRKVFGYDMNPAFLQHYLSTDILKNELQLYCELY
ncbi:MAG: hypothetical protein MI784_13075, partial [Cytophagales bacterium]|nr:hypothetical protein [Cytophagales bacterium]